MACEIAFRYVLDRAPNSAVGNVYSTAPSQDNSASIRIAVIIEIAGKKAITKGYFISQQLIVDVVINVHPDKHAMMRVCPARWVFQMHTTFVTGYPATDPVYVTALFIHPANYRISGICVGEGYVLRRKTSQKLLVESIFMTSQAVNGRARYVTSNDTESIHT